MNMCNLLSNSPMNKGVLLSSLQIGDNPLTNTQREFGALVIKWSEMLEDQIYFLNKIFGQSYTKTVTFKDSRNLYFDQYDFLFPYARGKDGTIYGFNNFKRVFYGCRIGKHRTLLYKETQNLTDLKKFIKSGFDNAGVLTEKGFFFEKHGATLPVLYFNNKYNLVGDLSDCFNHVRFKPSL